MNNEYWTVFGQMKLREIYLDQIVDLRRDDTFTNVECFNGEGRATKPLQTRSAEETCMNNLSTDL